MNRLKMLRILIVAFVLAGTVLFIIDRIPQEKHNQPGRNTITNVRLHTPDGAIVNGEFKPFNGEPSEEMIRHQPIPAETLYSTDYIGTTPITRQWNDIKGHHIAWVQKGNMADSTRVTLETINAKLDMLIVLMKEQK